MNKLFSKIAALSVGLAMAVGVGVAVGSKGEVTRTDAESGATLSISTYASNNNWVDTTAYPSITFDDIISITGKTGGNNNKYYQSNKSWRQYESNSAEITITASGGKTLTSATFTYASGNNGVLIYESTNIASGTEIALSGSSASFTVGHSSGTKSGNIQITAISVSYTGGSASTMVVKNSSGNQSPFAMTYGDLSGQLFYAYEEDGTSKITSGVTWTVSDSDILVLDDDFADNHCWVKPGTKVGEATLKAVKDGYNDVVSTITVGKGTLSSIAVSGAMTKTEYAVGSAWDPSGLVVTATYSTGYTADVTSQAEWTFSPETPNSTSVESVNAIATYTEDTYEQSAASEAQAVTVFAGAMYDFVTKFATYAASWGGYGPKTVSGTTDLGATYAATISFTNAQKASAGQNVDDRPVIAAKSGVTSTMLFQLDSSVSEDYNITLVEVAFKQWSATKKVGAYLYKGTTVTGEALDSFAQTDTPRNLTVSNLNGDSFIVDFTTTESSQNQQLGITSITIALEEKSSFGTLDHIKVTALPNTIYHVGEEFDAAGLQITAYDNADESKAAYKDVTAEATYSINDGHAFAEEEVPTITNTVTYEGKETSFDISVYALAEYEKVTEAPESFAGSYLLVASYTDGESVEHTVALNSALVNFDQPGNFKEVVVNDGVISTGQECEFVVAPYSSGYSMQGKNGKYAYGSSTYRFQASDEPKELSFNITDEKATIVGASSEGHSYNLVLKDNGDLTSRFGFYDNATANISLYRLRTSSAADEYAQLFLGAIACDASGETAPSFNIKEGETRWSWALLETEYDKLSSVEKEQFRLGAASETGDNIAQALAKYDYIVGKYGKSAFKDFMLRDPAPIAQGAGSISSNANSSTSFIIVIVASALTISAFSLVLVIRKRRHIK